MNKLTRYVRGHKHLRRLCKLLLNLSVLSLLSFLIWFGVLLFTKRSTLDPVEGSAVFVVAAIAFIWLCRLGSRSPWQPSMRVTVVSLVCLFLVAAFAGVQPVAEYKDLAICKIRDHLSPSSSYDVDILPGQWSVVNDWFITLDGGGWTGSTATVELTITNHGPRRVLGYYSLFNVGPELVAIDSTGKLVESWVREPDYNKGELWVVPSYTKEFYPDESWTGTLRFEMSLYSGKTKLYMTRYYHASRRFLFDIGEPRRGDQ